MAANEHDDFLCFKARKMYQERGLPRDQKYRDRLEYELGVITKMGFARYFLIVADLCRFMRERGILHNIRGSGCGSLVVWALQITHAWLDPVRLDIPFERFLNPSRVSNPDLDIDIIDARRHEVLDYTVKKYGADRVARIATFGTMGAKNAIKDVCRAQADELGHESYQGVANGFTGAMSVTDTIETALANNQFVQEQAHAYPQVIADARRIEGKVRNAGIHAAGVIIAPRPLTEFMPLYFDGSPDQREPIDWQPTTQWDMYDCEARGLLKMDFLGLKTLRVIYETVTAINYVKAQMGHADRLSMFLEEIPTDCPRTWAMLARGELAGVFQLEKQFVRNFAQRMNLRPGDLWSLAVLVSIIRPGMMDCGATELYLKRKGGQEPATPIIPKLGELGTLKTNYELIVFQEDAMLVARDLAGFPMPAADDLRKAIGKKLQDKMDAIHPKFIKGCVEHSHVTSDEGERVWSNIETAARYSFNRGHAAAYGCVTAYQTAWLKANYPLAYMTCLINSEAGVGSKEDGYNNKVAEYVEEARRLGIEIRQPSVRDSASLCKMIVPDNAILFGLEMIKGISHKAAEWIRQHARTATSFKEFILASFEVVQPVGADYAVEAAVRAPAEAPDELETKPAAAGGADEQAAASTWKVYSRIGKGDLEALIVGGAMDVFRNDASGRVLTRSQMLAMVPDLQKLAKKYWGQIAKQRHGSTRVKPADTKAKIDAYEIPDAMPKPMDLEEQLAREQEVTGCFLSRSPFSPFQAIVDKYCNTTAGEVAAGEAPAVSQFIGLLTKVSPTIIKNGIWKGHEMGFLGFAGVGGAVEAVCFAKEWEQVKQQNLERGKVFIARVGKGRQGGWVIQQVARLSDRNLGR